MAHTAPGARAAGRGDHTRPGPGQVRDALGPFLPPLAYALGGEVTDVRPVSDHPAGSPAYPVLTAPHDTEVIVVIGSTSVGATDQLRRPLTEQGACQVVEPVACRPGHPQLLVLRGAALADVPPDWQPNTPVSLILLTP
ncbi:molybdopterin-binding protein [Streptomyces sp. NPDC127119]|uniref:molybdopterin-binding protein n=1 Tax=Streptomyces sp. NPDC127119 TaxID=3345370 RepID=UPI00362E895C